MDDQVVEILKEIRDEAKQTNVRLESLEGRVEQTNVQLESLERRLEQTNTRLESVDGRLDFLERRVSTGLAALTSRLDGHVERIDGLTHQMTENQLLRATQVISLADVTRDVRALVEQAR